MRPPPLDNIRVLDLTRLLPGPLAAQHLADMGADVIKVEDTGAGDYARSSRGYFDLVNRNKRALKVDLKNPRGRELFMRLCETADVVLEGFRPGVVQRLGIDYAAVRAVNPAIVYCALSGYGQTGPFVERAGHDLNYCSYSGVTEQTGARDGPPVIPNLQIADLLGGTLSAAMGILAALLDAQCSGQGRYIDVSMADVTLAHNIMPLMAQNLDGATDPRGGGFLSGGLPWYAIYETSDHQYVSLGALEKKFWRAFCDRIGRPEWIDQQQAGAETREVIRSELTTLFKTRTREEWVTELAGTDCCFSPVLNLSESLTLEHFAARGMFVGSPGARQYAFPLKLSDFEFSVRRPAPGHGEHTAELLAELGYSGAEIGHLQEQGVI